MHRHVPRHQEKLTSPFSLRHFYSGVPMGGDNVSILICHHEMNTRQHHTDLNQSPCLWFYLHAMFFKIGKGKCTITDPFEKCHPSSTNIWSNINRKRISSWSFESNANQAKRLLTYETMAWRRWVEYARSIGITQDFFHKRLTEFGQQASHKLPR